MQIEQSSTTSANPRFFSSLSRHKKSAVAGLCALSFFLSGCGFNYSISVDDDGNGKSGRYKGVEIEAEMPAIPDGLDDFYTQELRWYDCDEAECAEVKAPLDYDNPNNGKTVTLALKRYEARKNAIGTLFINPGGPGGSGLDYADQVVTTWSKQMTGSFDIVGWDPRGVGQSSAVDCLTDKEKDEFFSAWSDYLTKEGLIESERESQEIARRCQAKSGALLPYVGTTSTARDLDMLRHLMGDPRLYYYGASYGTALGSTYADLFPQNTGRLVLDGAVDVSVPVVESDYMQVLGFERAARKYVEQCTKNCPLTGSDDDKMRQIQDFLDSMGDRPIPTDDPRRPLTKTLATYGVIVPLYSSQYDYLTAGLEQAINQHDGSILLQLADLYNGRNEDGTYQDNSNEAFWAINCADYLPTSAKEAQENGRRLEKDSLAFGSALSGVDICEAWPYHPRSNPKTPVAEGSEPILVVGTENDPATPYEWAQALSSNLENGHLLTWKDGEGHVAFARGSSCIDSAIEKFLLTGKIFNGDKTCR